MKIADDKCPMCRKNIPTSELVYDVSLNDYRLNYEITFRQRREMFMRNYMDDIQRMRTQIREDLEMERQEIERREREKLDSNCVIC